MKTMKRIKRRMNRVSHKHSESIFIRKRFHTFIQKLKLISSYKSKAGFLYTFSGSRFDFKNDNKDPGQGKISIPNE